MLADKMGGNIKSHQPALVSQAPSMHQSTHITENFEKQYIVLVSQGLLK